MNDPLDSRKQYYKDLLERSKWETVSDDEVASVARELEATRLTDPYTLLHILGRGGEQVIARHGILPQSYIKIVERFLGGRDDLLARLAWWILGWWGLAEHYITDMIEYVQGPPWPAVEARWAAIRAAGRYLSKASNPELLRSIIEVFENSSENPQVRSVAYLALSEMLGSDLRDLPLFYDDIDVKSPPDPMVLPKSKERLTREQES
jgi:hypothetical protein